MTEELAVADLEHVVVEEVLYAHSDDTCKGALKPEVGTETFGLLDDRRQQGRQQGKSTAFDFQCILNSV